MSVCEYHFGRFRLLPRARELWRGDTRETPARLVFDCLVYLVEHRERAVGRDEMVAAVWGRVDVAEARVSELMVRARRAVGDDGQAQRVIRTVPGFGYRWVAATEEVMASADEAREPVTADVHAGVGHGDGPGLDAEATPVVAAAQPRAQAEASSLAGAVVPAVAAHDEPASAAISKRYRWRSVALVLVLLAIAAPIAWQLRNATPAPTPTTVDAAASADATGSIIVLPLIIDAPPDAAWIRLGGMELVADRLRRADLPVLASDRVLTALRGADGRDLPLPQLRERLGAALTVQGRVQRELDGWRVVLEADRGDGDGALHHVESRHADVVEAALRASDLLLAALDRSAPAGVADTGLEQHLRRIQSALLASDVPAARAALAQTPEAMRDDWRVGFAEARIALFSGELDRAEAGLAGLLELPEVQADAVARSRVLSARATVAFRLARFEDAERDFLAAAAVLPAGQAEAERGTALSGLGIARVGMRNYDAAAADLGRARTAFRAAGDRYGLAQVDTNLGLLEAERGRLQQALAPLVDAADRFEALGAVERRLAVLDTVLDVQVGLLRWRDALATSDRQWVLRDAVGDPGLGASLAAGRAAVLLGLGRHRDAQTVLDKAGQRAAEVQTQAARYLLEHRAELELRLGQPARVRATVAQALEGWADNPGDLGRARMRLLRARADAMEGAAGESFADVGVDTNVATTAPALFVAAAETAVRNGDPVRAEALFERAVMAADGQGAPAQVALAVTAFGHWRLARGEHDAAAALAGRVAAWAEGDFECALLQLAVFHAIGPREPWQDSLRQAEDLAGERVVPAELRVPPGR